VRHILCQFWTAPAFHSVLAIVGEPACLCVEVMTGDHVMHSQQVTDIGYASIVAEALHQTFVKEPH